MTVQGHTEIKRGGIREAIVLRRWSCRRYSKQGQGGDQSREEGRRNGQIKEELDVIRIHILSHEPILGSL